jgi:cohesin loading factor subunit SCC2
MLWETRSYLRRLYGISFHAKQKEGKTNPKELSKALTKVHGVNGDRFWEAVSRIMGSLDNADAMVHRCREFATLLSIDDELKVTADDDRDSYDTAGDMDDAMSGLMGVNGSKPAKRKSSLSASGTPKKSKPRMRSSTTKKRASTDLEDDRAFD